MAIILWVALCFCIRERPNLTVELDSSAFFAQRIVHAVTDLLSFILNSFQPSPLLPSPPLPSLSICPNSPSYESHRTIFTDLGAKSQVMTGYLPLPKPWTLKLTKICIFFDEMIRSFRCKFSIITLLCAIAWPGTNETSSFNICLRRFGLECI